MSLMDDVRILDELAAEVREHGMAWLPGALRRHIQGVTVRRIADTFEERIMRDVKTIREQSVKIAALETEIDGLRDANEKLTDSILSAHESFTCSTCRRSVPWSEGAADSHPDLCDSCATEAQP